MIFLKIYTILVVVCTSSIHIKVKVIFSKKCVCPPYGLNGSDNVVFIFFVFPVSESANKL